MSQKLSDRDLPRPWRSGWVHRINLTTIGPPDDRNAAYILARHFVPDGNISIVRHAIANPFRYEGPLAIPSFQPIPGWWTYGPNSHEWGFRWCIGIANNHQNPGPFPPQAPTGQQQSPQVGGVFFVPLPIPQDPRNIAAPYYTFPWEDEHDPILIAAVPFADQYKHPSAPFTGDIDPQFRGYVRGPAWIVLWGFMYQADTTVPERFAWPWGYMDGDDVREDIFYKHFGNIVQL